MEAGLANAPTADDLPEPESFGEFRSLLLSNLAIAVFIAAGGEAACLVALAGRETTALLVLLSAIATTWLFFLLVTREAITAWVDLRDEKT